MTIDRRNARDIKAPTGPDLICGSWQTEAPFRMIQNNLDREVAENPDELVVYGGSPIPISCPTGPIGTISANWIARA